MTDINATAAPSLVVRRFYDATPERLFNAWTSPEQAASFMGPGTVKATQVTMDVRPGGAYRIVMVMDDGSTMPVRGTYREVDRHRRLSMTWVWEEEEPQDERETLVTLEFVPHGARTELVLTHTGFDSAQSRDNHQHGWTAIVDQLAAVI